MCSTGERGGGKWRRRETKTWPSFTAPSTHGGASEYSSRREVAVGAGHGSWMRPEGSLIAGGECEGRERGRGEVD